MTDTETLTNIRRSQHGDWIKQSKLGNTLKKCMRQSTNWELLPAHKQESLDMIATKISRILEGDPDHADHWEDVQGYAFLGLDGHKPMPVVTPPEFGPIKESTNE